MPVPFDSAALVGTGSCGCHQQVLGGPIASGMFTNIATNNAADGVYTLNGSSCALTDIIDVDSVDTANFDPVANIDADGILAFPNSDVQFGIKEPLLTSLLTNGFTILLELYVDPTGVVGVFAHDDPYNLYTSCQAVSNGEGLGGYIEVADKNGNVQDDTDHYPLVGQVNKIAFTLTADRAVGSVNGSPINLLSASVLDPTMTGVALNFGSNSDSRLRSFAFYEVVDDADLPSLSALS